MKKIAQPDKTPRRQHGRWPEYCNKKNNQQPFQKSQKKNSEIERQLVSSELRGEGPQKKRNTAVLSAHRVHLKKKCAHFK
jgi:invasion protein IalB